MAAVTPTTSANARPRRATQSYLCASTEGHHVLRQASVEGMSLHQARTAPYTNSTRRRTQEVSPKTRNWCPGKGRVAPQIRPPANGPRALLAETAAWAKPLMVPSWEAGPLELMRSMLQVYTEAEMGLMRQNETVRMLRDAATWLEAREARGMSIVRGAARRIASRRVGRGPLRARCMGGKTQTDQAIMMGPDAMRGRASWLEARPRPPNSGCADAYVGNNSSTQLYAKAACTAARSQASQYA